MRICDWKYKKESGQQNGSYDEYIKEISEKIDSKKGYYAEISNKIWEFAEPRFQEYRSSELLQHVLKQAGFSTSRSGRREDMHLLQNMDQENQS